ncbi:hypothetical protein ACFQY7_53670 [Actinomadura luteofluorescens]|uniref:hypothetical protein n=1 Tax=Actinomadura luteofluorescens TaxID=46163 RepID=UPI00364564E9
MVEGHFRGSSPRSSPSRAVIAAMMSSVAARRVSRSSGSPAYRVRSTGGPAITCILLRGSGWTPFFRLPARPFCSPFLYGISSCAPQLATGTTWAPVLSAIRAAPVWPVIGHSSGSRVQLPSG